MWSFVQHVACLQKNNRDLSVFVYKLVCVVLVNVKYHFAHCRFSSLSESEKTAAFSLWQKNWNQFIQQSLDMHCDY